MADPRQRLAANVPGSFYVDATCIDCATCRVIATDSFGRVGEQSAVVQQPADLAAQERALKALVACPTSSIGAAPGTKLAPILERFPDPIDGPVSYCGFATEASFGSASYFVARKDGNVLVDVPRFAAPLVKSLERLGGVRWLFLTHQDDVAGHERFAQHFGCTRVIHAGDRNEDTADVEHVIDGDGPTALAPDLLAIPTPGHTRGSACLLVGDRYLFSGDHLAKNPRDGSLYAFKSACWFDWPTQIRSMKRLRDHRFEWVLPGHGHRFHADAAGAAAALEGCIRWMEAPENEPW